MRIELGAEAYDVLIGPGLLISAGEQLALDRRVLIVTDTNVPAEYAEAVIKASSKPVLFVMRQGEASKNIDTLKDIITVMASAGFDRGDCAVAVGGGVVGDITGLAAALYMRGIDFYNVPTTVLSQVDSSVGGKTAVDFAGVKNLIGAFKQPNKVIIDTDTLKTLPLRQINNGLCEAVKMAATSDPELFDMFLNGDIYGNMDRIIEKSLAVKKSVVERDVRETGLRRVLNFGHTIGHGIEISCGGALYHGECVALGMLPMSSGSVREKLLKIYDKLGLQLKVKINADAVMSAVMHDKKKNADKIKAVTVQAPGSFSISDMSFDELRRRLESLL